MHLCCVRMCVCASVVEKLYITFRESVRVIECMGVFGVRVCGSAFQVCVRAFDCTFSLNRARVLSMYLCMCERYLEQTFIKNKILFTTTLE